ncbi:MAG: XdhC family protein [Ignavibacteria bacterium]|nr:XdhC family protein [Ignavibacteria bacterium]
MKDLSIWKVILSCFQNNTRSLLMIVVESEGFSPGKPGFKMVVTEDGRLTGSIGGGVMEYNMVEKARDMLLNKNTAPLLQTQVHDEESKIDKSDMICGGKQTILFFPLQTKHRSTIEEIIRTIEGNKTGKVTFSQSGISFISDSKGNENKIFKQVSEHEWSYKENIGIRNTAYIIGGGHVGLAVSRILSTLEFYVVVIDDRSEVSTLIENTYADEIITIPFDEVRNCIPEGDSNYVVIMTPSHRADEIALKQLIHKKLAYLGMMGSSRKVEEVFNNLKEAGITEEKLKKVHAPIGFPIKSNTPEEIAISIAAEIIQVKNSVIIKQ